MQVPDLPRPISLWNVDPRDPLPPSASPPWKYLMCRSHSLHRVDAPWSPRTRDLLPLDLPLLISPWKTDLHRVDNSMESPYMRFTPSPKSRVAPDQPRPRNPRVLTFNQGSGARFASTTSLRR
jgi:hypothetical protein